MTDSEQRFHAPFQLGSEYQVQKFIGSGVIGTTWRGAVNGGVDLSFTILHERFASDPQVVRHLLAERPLLSAAHSKNIVPVIDLFAESDVTAIVNPFIEGESLADLLEREGTITPAKACQLLAGVAQGLAALHSTGVVHRNVKPNNILINDFLSRPVAMITDYVAVGVLEEWASQDNAVVLASAPAYLAPEVLAGSPATVQSDLYAVGTVLYEALCGVTPFAPLDADGMMQAILTLNPGRPVGVDDGLWEVISGLLSREPLRRGSADALAWRLASLADSLEQAPALPKITFPPEPSPLPKVVAFTTETGNESHDAGQQFEAIAAPDAPMIGDDIDRSIPAGSVNASTDGLNSENGVAVATDMASDAKPLPLDPLPLDPSSLNPVSLEADPSQTKEPLLSNPAPVGGVESVPATADVTDTDQPGIISIPVSLASNPDSERSSKSERPSARPKDSARPSAAKPKSTRPAAQKAKNTRNAHDQHGRHFSAAGVIVGIIVGLIVGTGVALAISSGQHNQTRSAPVVTVSPEVSSTAATPTPLPSSPWPPTAGVVCRANTSVAVAGNTACTFGVNVYQAYQKDPINGMNGSASPASPSATPTLGESTTVLAYNSGSGHYVQMSCEVQAANVVKCTGSPNQTVYIRTQQ